MDVRRVASLKTAEEFRRALDRLGVVLAFDEVVEAGPDAPLARPYRWRGGTVGNRFAILPMEGWDGQEDGKPSDLTRRRWEHFGISGAKLIWGGEAVAVRHDGRANPNQLLMNDANLASIEQLREILVAAHRERFGRDDDLYIGLQLTHSGRFSKPNDKRRLEPQILYRHPCLDRKFGLSGDEPVMTDEAIDRLIGDFVRAAAQARKAGYAFVDVKHCHGYLGHEFLSAVDRPGRYGGSFENRTRFLREVVAGIRAEAPGLEVGVRVSLFDFIPFQPGPDRIGEPMPMPGESYRHAFGGDSTGLGVDLAEPSRFLDLLSELGIHWVCTTGGSPYYNPHIQRPAAFPPPTATCRRKTRSSAWRARSTWRPSSSSAIPTWRSSARATPTCRNGCPTSASASSATAAPTSSGSAAWSCPIPSSPPTSWPAARRRARRSAAPSATAPPRPATGSSPAASRSTRSTRGSPRPRSSPASSARPRRPERDGRDLSQGALQLAFLRADHAPDMSAVRSSVFQGGRSRPTWMSARTPSSRTVSKA